jgi:hypothetical protein
MDKTGINLKGMAVGDGLTDALRQFDTYATTAVSAGIISQSGSDKFKKQESLVKQLIYAGKYRNATAYIL